MESKLSKLSSLSNKQLFDYLIWITKTWNGQDIVPKREYVRVRRIGQELDNRGGYPMMCDAYYTAKQRHCRGIKACWEGIGMWRC